MEDPQRMDDAINTKKTYQANLQQKRPTGRPKTRWGKKGVEKDIMLIEIINWGQVAQDRDERRRIQLNFTLKIAGIPAETCW
jgi:hypothetical protein